MHDNLDNCREKQVTGKFSCMQRGSPRFLSVQTTVYPGMKAEIKAALYKTIINSWCFQSTF